MPQTRPGDPTLNSSVASPLLALVLGAFGKWSPEVPPSRGAKLSARPHSATFFVLSVTTAMGALPGAP
eukprot:3299012-Alexandrium_andersonii.AAC.1